MYVVMLREQGMFLVEPVAGVSQREAIERALGFGGGYSAGRVAVELAADADQAWACWVEGKDALGKPYFMFRAFPAELAEAEVEAQLQALGEEPVKMNLTRVHWARDSRERLGEGEPEPQEFR
ncbi:MAG: hypothetical protein K0R39_2224 [Symbiobacteriaceae bacterium]|nr:hypothetical protein [Symbiobacteriaceae bacterium]